MKFPHSMLLDFVRTDLDAQGLGDLLTMAGFELEGIEDVEGEPVLDIKVMSNRGDGLSVFGLSREVLAKDANAVATDLYRRAARYFDDVAFEDGPEGVVTVETPDCTRYAAALFDFAGGETPGWMARRLTQAGMRPISLLVDVTNYVLLEIGQPLHAFDRDKLAGGRIVVRQARAGERITTLNGEEHTLRPEQMMICDGERPVAVAGVMGGAESEVSDDTVHVLLESAHFANTSIRRTRKQLGLSTEASYRFERSVDRELVSAGLRRTLVLLREITGQSIPGAMSAFWGPESDRSTVSLRPDRASRFLGMEIDADLAANYLGRLGFAVARQGDVLEVTRPTWRPDVEREVDLIEELGRVHGYERIPERLPEGTTTAGGLHGIYLQRERLAQAMLRLGFHQIVSHSLRTESPLDRATGRIAPRTPASPEHGVLRNSNLPCLADAVRRNGGRDLHLFEVGRVFSETAGVRSERLHLAVVTTGAVVAPRRKGDVVPEADFLSLKGVLAEAWAAVGVDPVLAVPATPDPRFHPTRQAEIHAGGTVVGHMGQVHPQVAEQVGLPALSFLAEVDVDAALEAASPELRLKPLSRNPAIERDIAILVDRSVPYAEVEAAIRAGAGGVLERLSLFDVYEGANLPEGKHSLGVRLTLRKMGSNFTDEEANQVRESVVAALAGLGATTR